jgi:FkbM family methyltransferase
METFFIIDCLRPTDVFIDVGANIGFYTTIAGRRGAFVVAFEPGRLQGGALRTNICLNSLGAVVEVIPCAVADFSGEASFTADLEVSNHLVLADGLGVVAQRTSVVDVLTLDEVLARRQGIIGSGSLTIIKIDAEGFDLDVLRGAEDTVRRLTPVIIAEIWEGGIAVRQWLESREYDVYYYRPEVRALERLPLTFVGQANLIAVHPSRSALVANRLATAERPPIDPPRIHWRTARSP